MKLFVLRTEKNGQVVRDRDGNVMYFDNKMDAKDARDSIGGNTVVSYGPDHKKFTK
jgi:hypothetical protein